jgi:hypothetical protein
VYVRPAAPRSIGGEVDDAIRLWRQALAKTWPLALAAQLLVSIPLLLFRVPMQAATGQSSQLMLSTKLSPQFWLSYIAAALLASGFYNAVVSQTASTASSEPAPMSASLRIGFRLLPRALLLGLAMGFVVCILASLFMVPTAFLDTSARLVLMGSLAAVLLFLAGRIFLANLVLVVNNVGVIDSLESSWNLTRGHWWRSAAILTVTIIIFTVFLFVIGAVTGAATVVLGRTSSAALAVSESISILGNALFTPLFSAVMLTIYYDLKLRKEGADLAARVNALASQ